MTSLRNLKLHDSDALPFLSSMSIVIATSYLCHGVDNVDHALATVDSAGTTTSCIV